ncbi:hypothetical protein BpHYR1_025258 [Brachionus plicatilis]|uniref:Uncharacterized protein n=1 Tax=Brachionus plicatilis TaxID=10195 RepID=A0A3M7SDH6_BRAPC|nr:hypothetical protein BpHYR1_025258 [Brachionus plicatilis]
MLNYKQISLIQSKYYNLNTFKLNRLNKTKIGYLTLKNIRINTATYLNLFKPFLPKIIFSHIKKVQQSMLQYAFVFEIQNTFLIMFIDNDLFKFLFSYLFRNSSSNRRTM